MDIKIDWNELWKERMELQSKTQRNTDCTNMWKRKENAKRFWEMSLENKDRIEKTLDGMVLTPESRVLDIGAGPGSLAIPLAERVAHVTAVEPAEGMMEILKQNIETYEVRNIDCVYKDWETVDAGSDLCPPYDVVFASYSLGMKDIRASIQKMVDVSSGYVYLYWFAGDTSWDIHSQNLWPILHGYEYRQGPKADVLYNVLYDMGIYPDVEVFPFEHKNRFENLKEALEHFKPQYAAFSSEQEEILRSYLQEVLEEENGALIQKGWSTRVKMWWKVSAF
ncbi:SAM-dependent methlyltransferase [Methanosarcina sp. 2.H.T.1A.6]|uniref:class I SAM-dependent methyltransferase n=1 Tax=unclassified Methanosarcina TaxID=2644672 RepID=UPI0006219F75|nr:MULTISPECIES: class I SAM-dependent methyltransferase [unclassified Methanosarcina]KKG10775.1 SAM-dependent methlyltransferase [Methanosarcina sp. 2.H.T.1A.15]KKG14238.1 SAM-dependent methlyltransferase [Methanosarcina sp. 2.H.T.1A.3]KKG19728.1 SAM-dependent methlyltransferase [Methanosarcina sp. 2.H.T.1A.6]KKG27115.1 SAM-dependent methlyltransferase [Methanosarcina sp. 2.H.T.1A.8]